MVAGLEAKVHDCSGLKVLLNLRFMTRRRVDVSAMFPLKRTFHYYPICSPNQSFIINTILLSLLGIMCGLEGFILSFYIAFITMEFDTIILGVSFIWGF